MYKKVKAVGLIVSMMALLFLGIIGINSGNAVKADSQEQPPSNKTIPVTGGGASGNNIKGAVISSKQSGFKVGDTFLTRKAAEKLADELKSNGGYRGLGGDPVITLAVRSVPGLGWIYNISKGIGQIQDTASSNSITNKLKHHSGIVIETVESDQMQPGGSYLGGWNGKLSSAESFVKRSGNSITHEKINW
ncbi:hypothetical protein OF387_00620 [Lentilactobacillus hilgardii]|nr:hypothetical protein [Lentilactobacillus hilgardii]MCV3739720.1 hypothetical protein [Lentilactobacillus hilgardii]